MAYPSAPRLAEAVKAAAEAAAGRRRFAEAERQMAQETMAPELAVKTLSFADPTADSFGQDTYDVLDEVTTAKEDKETEATTATGDKTEEMHDPAALAAGPRGRSTPE